MGDEEDEADVLMREILAEERAERDAVAASVAASIAADAEALRAECHAMKLEAVRLKRAGDMDGAREALRRAKALAARAEAAEAEAARAGDRGESPGAAGGGPRRRVLRRVVLGASSLGASLAALEEAVKAAKLDAIAKKRSGDMAGARASLRRSKDTSDARPPPRGGDGGVGKASRSLRGGLVEHSGEEHSRTRSRRERRVPFESSHGIIEERLLRDPGGSPTAAGGFGRDARGGSVGGGGRLRGRIRRRRRGHPRDRLRERRRRRGGGRRASAPRARRRRVGRDALRRRVRRPRRVGRGARRGRGGAREGARAELDAEAKEAKARAVRLRREEGDAEGAREALREAKRTQAELERVKADFGVE